MSETQVTTTPESVLDDMPSLHALRELRALQAITNEPALELLAQELHDQVRADIAAQGIGLKELALRYIKELEPVIELALVVVLSARHEYRAGRDLSEMRGQATSYLSALELYVNHIKIFFLYEFRGELPLELTEILRQLPMPNLAEIEGLIPAEPEVPAAETTEDVAAHAASEEDLRKVAEETDTSAADETDAATEEIEDLGSTQGEEEPEAVAAEPEAIEPAPQRTEAVKPPANTRKSTTRKARTTAAKSAAVTAKERTPRPTRLAPESIDTTAYTKISPEYILASPAMLELLQHAFVTIGGRRANLQMEDIYLLAILKNSTEGEVNLSTPISRSNMTSILLAQRGLRYHGGSISRALERIGEALLASGQDVLLQNNGQKTRARRYWLIDDAGSVKFWLIKDEAENKPPKATRPSPVKRPAKKLVRKGKPKTDTPKSTSTKKPPAKASTPPEKPKPAREHINTEPVPQDETGGPTTEEIEEYTNNIFDKDIRGMFNSVLRRNGSVAILELQERATVGQVREFIEKLKKWAKQVEGFYTLSIDDAGNIEITKVERQVP